MLSVSVVAKKISFLYLVDCLHISRACLRRDKFRHFNRGCIITNWRSWQLFETDFQLHSLHVDSIWLTHTHNCSFMDFAILFWAFWVCPRNSWDSLYIHRILHYFTIWVVWQGFGCVSHADFVRQGGHRIQVNTTHRVPNDLAGLFFQDFF